MSVSPGRAAAFDILLRVERESSYASDLLHSANYDRLSIPDHALATELVMGVLRWRSRLDAEIALVSSQPLVKLDLEILIALRLAVYQFLWLDRIPQRAALHESVELAKRARKRSAAPFVNAVLRKLSGRPRNKNGIEDETEDQPTPQDIGHSFAHPPWLVERWGREYGLAVARKICVHNQAVPTTSIRLRVPGTGNRQEEELKEEGIALASGGLLASARRVQTGDVTNTEAFRAGRIVIQDEASQLVAALVSSQASHEGSRILGSRILDCCAAPGMKTLAMADQNPATTIVAVEIHPHRARLLQKLIHGQEPRVQIVLADVQHLPLSFPGRPSPFERVLADVPCSGTGTLARNPEIKWRLKADDLTDLHARQVAILRSAMAQVAPGGCVVYSTCSLEKEENEDVVEQVLSKNEGSESGSFRLHDCRAVLDQLKKREVLTWPDTASLTRGPYLRTVPGVHPCDGFFAAILERV